LILTNLDRFAGSGDGCCQMPILPEPLSKNRPQGGMRINDEYSMGMAFGVFHLLLGHAVSEKVRER
jgi:hypothetical protein